MTELYALQFDSDYGEAKENFKGRSYRLAHRIAHNRTVAGVHFPIDSAAGCMLGDQLAKMVLAQMENGQKKPDQSQVDTVMAGWDTPVQFDTDAELQKTFQQSDVEGLTRQQIDLGILTPSRTPILRTLWENVTQEMQAQQIEKVQ
jgi:hypothetical protein